MSLLAVVACAFALGAVAVVARWWPRRRDSLGRARPFPVWSVVVLVLLAAAPALAIARNSQQESRLERVAGVLSGRSVSVTCQSAAGAFVDAGPELGFVPFDVDGVPLPETTLKHEPCLDLRAYAAGDQRDPTLDEVIAVHVLTHEAMHLRGETDESVAECQAVQRDARTARLLGATPAQAHRLARRYWLEVYPSMPDGYRTGDCRAGGRLDEGLADAPWAVLSGVP